MQNVQQHSVKGWLAALFLFALLIKAMVPAGWMPSVQGDGVQLMLCTTQGLITFDSDLTDDDTPPSQPCIFAASGMDLLPKDTALRLTMAFLYWVAPASIMEWTLQTASDHPLPPSTAPPATR